MADDRSLPGWPKKKLVKDARRQLAHYGIRPTRPAVWQATWAWAAAIARSYYHDHWPLPSEIASLYIFLLLADIEKVHPWRLPYRAAEFVPPEVKDRLPSGNLTFPIALLSRPRRKRAVVCKDTIHG